LIIDDEPMVARLTAMVLEHLGLKPTTEHTGVEAIARLRQSLTDGTSGYRVCVVDLTMPDLSGPDLLRQIKALAPDLPVLLTSGFSEQQLRVRGAFSGFDGFIQKPFRMSAMVDVLRKMLDE
jgi:two-component system cell cycle sensor histidine kinase/response regulator CckA